MEEWKDVPGYGGKYKISTLGRVRHGEYIFKPSTSTWGGYEYITLSSPNRKKYLLHRLMALTFIDGFEKCNIVDHIDMNVRNNKLSNLRVSNKSLNAMNYIKNGENCSSKYKGVSYHKQSGKWHAYIGSQKKRINLGLFKDEKQAALAYDKKASELYGEYARLNLCHNDL